MKIEEEDTSEGAFVVGISEADYTQLKQWLDTNRSSKEEAKMMELAKRGQLTEVTIANGESEYDLERAERVLPVVQLLLGIE